MNGQYDISIIIPCHNLENYILPLLSSFKLLNFGKYTGEFIFILDACTDNTKAIIKKEMNDLDYKIIECNHHSCGLARNEGLEMAHGRYIWFVDGDDWIIYYDVIPNCLDAMDKSNSEIIRLKYVSNYFNIDYFSMVWQYIYRRDYIGDLRFLSIQPNEDVEWSKILLKPYESKAIPFYNIPAYFYNYLRPGSNMTKYIEKEKIVD